MSDAESFAGIGHNRPPKDKPILPVTMVLACARVPVRRLGHLIPQHWKDTFRFKKPNIHACCRSADDHDIEAFKSKPEISAPDIYHFHCNACGRKHIFFCIGTTGMRDGIRHVRPVWRVR